VIDVQSDLGVATKFTITLPITLAIISALIVDVAGRSLAIPLATIQEAQRLDPADIRRVDGREVLTLRGSTLPICRLEHVLGYAPMPEQRRGRQFVVVIELGNRRLGFVVDVLNGQEDVVIKTLGASLRNVRGIAGATDRGDQRLVLVLDASGLLDEVLESTETLRLSGEASS
jgi:two-component system chemotaxis sensor kinase CheA